MGPRIYFWKNVTNTQRPRNKLKTTAITMQRRGRYASITIDLLLEMVFSIRSVQRGYKEENWSDPDG
jgi:hypothetical protein